MPRAARCELRTKSSRIDAAYTEVNETGRKGIDDGQCNRNEEEQGSEDNVGQNESMFRQLLYVFWQIVLVRDIYWGNGVQ